MSITRASRIVTTMACYSMIVTGSFDDLDALATLIASNVNPGHLHVSLIESPVGWRLQITSDDNYYPDHAHDLVEQRIREGVAVTIASGLNPMPTYIYTASKQDTPIDVDEVELPFSSRCGPLVSSDERYPKHTERNISMDHLIAVGNVTEHAEQLLRELGGSVHYVSSVPPVLLVCLPDPVFEYMDSGSRVRIKVRADTPLIWRGHHPGPAWTSVEETSLESEYGEPREEATEVALEDLSLDDHPF